MKSKISFHDIFGKIQTVRQRNTRRSLCVVGPEISCNIHKAMPEYSKTLSPYIKKAVISVLWGLNAQYT